MNVDVVLVKCDDWQGLYLNGDLAKEDHNLRLDVVGKLLVNKTINSFQSVWFDYEEYATAEPYWSNLPFSLDTLRPFLEDN